MGLQMADSTVRTRSRRSTRGDIKKKIKDWAPIVTGVAALCFSIVNALVQKASDHKHDVQEQAYHSEEQQHYAEAQKHYAEEQQRIAIQDMPVISVEQDVDSSDPINGIYISNKSPVIARLKNLTFIVNGKKVDDIEGAYQAHNLRDLDYYDIGDNYPMAAGEEKLWLVMCRTK